MSAPKKIAITAPRLSATRAKGPLTSPGTTKAPIPAARSMTKKKTAARKKGQLAIAHIVYGALEKSRKQEPIVKQRTKAGIHHTTSMYPK